ncbi:toll-like receptor 3 [Diadema setosum]|uniref:toll-like receptor 3 n=1 Tax=Diadema setosum TaxID=31175 RepID=UPI003B3B79ED
MSFAAYGKLQVLILRWNALTQIEGNSFEHLLDLRVDNVISLFERNLLIYTPNLTRLYLHHNHLTTISANTYFPATLVRLDISYNPFTCDCSLAWFQNWLHTTNVNATPFNETLCSQSSFKEIVNLPLEAFYPGDFCGINAPLISGLISGSVIVTLLGLLIYRKRWWLNYKIFLLKLFVLGYKQQEEDLQANDYEYELNIMCQDYDDDWAHGVFRPALEKRMPHLQRVAYGDEALRISMYYIDAVHHIIETSYKTVLLISNHCADDAWFITKVRVALEHVNETGLDKVILIFLEDIPDERLPYLVRLFLSRNRPNLVWTEDHDGQDLFWAYFKKSMQTNPQINHVLPI